MILDLKEKMTSSSNKAHNRHFSNLMMSQTMKTKLTNGWNSCKQKFHETKSKKLLTARNLLSLPPYRSPL